MLFTFPSRYWFTIGLQRVFSLGGWARRIHTGFHVPRATQDTARIRQASCKGLSPAVAALSNAVPLTCVRSSVAVLQPRRNRNPGGLGSSPFARHYWGNHVLFSLPPGTKMFQFPGLASRIKLGLQVFSLQGCPIQRSGDQRSLAPTPGLSQLATSFIAFWSLGIHRTPLRTFACILLTHIPYGTYEEYAYTLAFISCLLPSAGSKTNSSCFYSFKLKFSTFPSSSGI